MTMSDPIADMLTRIRNANTAKHDTVDVPASKMKLAIANILLDEGYIEKYDVVEDGVFKTIHIALKYGADKNEKVITGLKRISKSQGRDFVDGAVDRGCFVGFASQTQQIYVKVEEVEEIEDNPSEEISTV